MKEELKIGDYVRVVKSIRTKEMVPAKHKIGTKGIVHSIIPRGKVEVMFRNNKSIIFYLEELRKL